MIEFLEHHLFTCSFKSLFGVPCPGCGMQRALLSLLKGDLLHSLQLNPALIPFIITILYSLFHLRFNFGNGPKNIVIMFSFTVLLMTVNFVIKLIC
ncbi:MAG TPA: DUF2752 domain-containing protein [Bacteroidia bacterium]|nr:DUF2752 domain-containing protein [Bacteroidia bacterium]